MAGGGFAGFTKALFSSKLAVAALAAALAYGAVKLYNSASGAQAVRAALEGMNQPGAPEWRLLTGIHCDQGRAALSALPQP